MEQDPLLLVIEGTYPWYRGGVSEWVHQYLNHIDNRPFNIVQIATDQYRNAPIAEALYEIPEHVQKFERIAPPTLAGFQKSELNTWLDSISHQVASVFQESGIIHIANTGFAGWLGKEMALKFQKPLLLTEHALYWKEIEMGAVALECGYQVPEEQCQKALFADMFEGIAREVYQHSDAVVSVSMCNIPQQKQMGAEHITYLPNGIADDWLLPADVQPSSALTIGWVGRCAEMKNPMKFFELIEAFQQADYENISFLMLSCDAGEPELQKRVKEQSQKYDNLQLVWNRSTEEYIDQMDALCITSHNESQPLVLFEAIARKVLPVGWEAGDVTQKYGLILDANAPCTELVSEIMKCWKNPDDWQKEVEKRFVDVKKHHIWSDIFARYQNLFISLLNK